MEQLLSKREERIIQTVLFFIVLVLVVGLFAQVGLHIKGFSYNPNTTEGYVEYQADSYNWQLKDDLNAPQKKYSEIAFTIDPNLKTDTDMIFYTFRCYGLYRRQAGLYI